MYIHRQVTGTVKCRSTLLIDEEVPLSHSTVYYSTVVLGIAMVFVFSPWNRKFVQAGAPHWLWSRSQS